jgi:adenylate cyclase
MPHLHYLPDEQTVQAQPTDTILDCSLEAGIPHVSICGGKARCSTCRVFVLEGLEGCSPRNASEQAIATQLGLEDRIRLACQTQVRGDGKILLRRLTLDREDLEVLDDQIKGRSKPEAIGHEQKIAILFADLRGFTTFAESLPAYDVIYILNRYFHRMGKIVDRHDGMINNYMGDGLMALFGWKDPAQAATRSVQAAVEMVVAMDSFNHYLESTYHKRLNIGIGIHYGEVVIGLVGAGGSQQMTAIGDAVNLASRIEAANKKLGTTLLVSEAVYHEVQSQVEVNQRCAVDIPGKTGQYMLYEIQGIEAVDTFVQPLVILPRISWWMGLRKFCDSRFGRRCQRLWTRFRKLALKL